MIRLARSTDARAIRTLQEEYAASLGVDASLMTLAAMRARMASEHIVWTVGDEGGVYAYCEVKRHQNRRFYDVMLLPRGMGRGRLHPVKQLALQTMLARYPDSGAWRIEGRFPMAVDPTLSRRDQGESEARAWKQMHPGADVRLVDSEYVISYTLAGAAGD